MRCKRCGKLPGVFWAVSPCGCVNLYCEACADRPDFEWWVGQYAKLHADVGGRYENGGPWPCPTMQGAHEECEVT